MDILQVFVQLINVDFLHLRAIGRINKVTERNVCPLIKAVDLWWQYVEPVVSLLSDARYQEMHVVSIKSSSAVVRRGIPISDIYGGIKYDGIIYRVIVKLNTTVYRLAVLTISRPTLPINNIRAIIPSVVLLQYTYLRHRRQTDDRQHYDINRTMQCYCNVRLMKVKYSRHAKRSHFRRYDVSNFSLFTPYRSTTQSSHIHSDTYARKLHIVQR